MHSKRTMDRLLLPRVREEPEGVDRPVPDAMAPLPRWQTIPLDSKFPVAPAPKGEVTFVTTKMCEPAYKSKQTEDFDLSDPYNYQSKSEYKPLCDPYLKAWFAKPGVKKQLLKQNLITEDGRVPCSVQDFNDYRFFLRRQAALAATPKIDRKQELAQERRKLLREEAKMRAELFTVEVKYKALKVKEKRKAEEEDRRKSLEEKVSREEAREEKRVQEQSDRLFEKVRREKQKEDQRFRAIRAKERRSQRESSNMLMAYERKAQETLDKIDYLREQRIYELDQKKKAQWQRKREHQEQILEDMRRQQERVEALKRTHQRRYEEDMVKKMAKEAAAKKLAGQMEPQEEKVKKRKEKQDAFAKRMAYALQDTGQKTIQQPPKEDLKRTCSLWLLDELLHRLGLNEDARRLRDAQNSLARGQALDNAVTAAVNKMAQASALGKDQEMLSKILHLLVRKIIEAYPGKEMQDVTEETSQDPGVAERTRLFPEVDETVETEQAVRITMCATMDLDKNWEEPITLGADFLPREPEPSQADELHDEFFKTSMRMAETDTLELENNLKDYLNSIRADSLTPEQHAKVIKTCLMLICHEPITDENLDIERNPDGLQVLGFEPGDLPEDEVIPEYPDVEQPKSTDPNLEEAKSKPPDQENERPKLEEPEHESNPDPPAEEQGREGQGAPGDEGGNENQSNNRKLEQTGSGGKVKAGKGVREGQRVKVGGKVKVSGKVKAGEDASQNAGETNEEPQSGGERRGSGSEGSTGWEEETMSGSTALTETTVRRRKEEEEFNRAFEAGDIVLATQLFVKKLQERERLEHANFPPARLQRFVAMSLPRFWRRQPDDDEHELGKWLRKLNMERDVNNLLTKVKCARLPPAFLREMAVGIASAAVSHVGVPDNYLTDGVVRMVLDQFLSDLQDDKVSLRIIEMALHNVMEEFEAAQVKDTYLKVMMFLLDVLNKTENKLRSGLIPKQRVFYRALMDLDELSQEEKDKLLAGPWRDMIHETKVLIQLDLVSAEDKARLQQVVISCGQSVLGEDGLDLSDDPQEVVDRLYTRMGDPMNSEDTVINMCVLVSANTVKALMNHQDLPRITSMTLFPGALNISQSAMTGGATTHLGAATLSQCVVFLLLDKLSRDMGENTLNDATKTMMAGALKDLMQTQYGLTQSELEGDKFWTELDSLRAKLRFQSSAFPESVKMLSVLLKPCLVEVMGHTGPPDSQGPLVSGQQASDSLVRLITQVFVVFVRGILDRLRRAGLCKEDSVDIQVMYVWRTLAGLTTEARSVISDVLVEREDSNLLNRIQQTDSLLLEGFIQSARGDDSAQLGAESREGAGPQEGEEPDSVGEFLSTVVNQLEDPGYIPVPSSYPEDPDRPVRSRHGRAPATTQPDKEEMKRSQPTPEMVERCLRFELIQSAHSLAQGLTSTRALQVMATTMADHVACTVFVLDQLVAGFHDRMWKLRTALQQKKIQSDNMLDYLLYHKSSEVKPPLMNTEKAVQLTTGQAIHLEKLQNCVRTMARMVESLSRMVRDEQEVDCQPAQVLGAVSPDTLTQVSRSVLLSVCRVMTNVINGREDTDILTPGQKQPDLQEEKVLLASYLLVRNELSSLRNTAEQQMCEEDQSWTPRDVAGCGDPSVLALPIEVVDRVFARLGGIMESFKEISGEDCKFCEPGSSTSELTNFLINQVMSSVAYRVDIGQFPFVRVKDMVRAEQRNRSEKAGMSTSEIQVTANVTENRSMNDPPGSLTSPLENFQQDVSKLLIGHILQVMACASCVLKIKSDVAILVDESHNSVLRARSFLDAVRDVVQEDYLSNRRTLVIGRDIGQSGILKGAQGVAGPSSGSRKLGRSLGGKPGIVCDEVSGSGSTKMAVPAYIKASFESMIGRAGETYRERRQFLEVLEETFQVLDLHLMNHGAQMAPGSSLRGTSSELCFLVLQMIKGVLEENKEQFVKLPWNKSSPVSSTPTRPRRSSNPYAMDVMERGRRIDTLLKRRSALNTTGNAVADKDTHQTETTAKRRSSSAIRANIRRLRPQVSLQAAQRKKNAQQDAGGNTKKPDSENSKTPARPRRPCPPAREKSTTLSRNTSTEVESSDSKEDSKTQESDTLQPWSSSSKTPNTNSASTTSLAQKDRPRSADSRGFFFDRPHQPSLDPPYYLRPARYRRLREARTNETRASSSAASEPEKKPDETRPTESDVQDDTENDHENTGEDEGQTEADSAIQSAIVSMLELELPEEMAIYKECVSGLSLEEQQEIELVSFLAAMDNLREKLSLEDCSGMEARELLQWVDETPSVSQKTAASVGAVLRKLNFTCTGLFSFPGISEELKEDFEAKKEFKEKMIACVESMSERAEESYPVSASLYPLAEAIVQGLKDSGLQILRDETNSDRGSSQGDDNDGSHLDDRSSKVDEKGKDSDSDDHVTPRRSVTSRASSSSWSEEVTSCSSGSETSVAGGRAGDRLDKGQEESGDVRKNDDDGNDDDDDNGGDGGDDEPSSDESGLFEEGQGPQRAMDQSSPQNEPRSRSTSRQRADGNKRPKKEIKETKSSFASDGDGGKMKDATSDDGVDDNNDDDDDDDVDNDDGISGDGDDNDDDNSDDDDDVDHRGDNERKRNKNDKLDGGDLHTDSSISEM